MARSIPSSICLVAILSIGLVVPSAVAIDGPLASATVSFGLWRTDPPLDRFPNLSDRLRNEHQLIPSEVKIKAGGAVNFLVGGFHQPIVYGDGTLPADIDTNIANTTPSTGIPANVPLINDPVSRIYRGQDPSRQPMLFPSGPVSQDRVEVVHFPKPGTYLVICGVRAHFVDDGMFGFVKVLP
jgi:hypothetical protein